ncbi:FecR family protein [Pedobacter gandavensis]|uniref:FecR family protein n=1 Tax=Pedobacter gandavensis TaxID=2679963 RepID=UPI00292CB0A2|nr:FecR family protein [Pedobacter gandavensis]
MSEKEFIALYEQYLQGKCSPEEILLLESYQDDFQWKTWTADLGNKERIHDEIYQRLHQEMNPLVFQTRFSSKRWVIAASLFLICSTGIGYFYLQKQHVETASALNAQVFETKSGEKKQIQLQDGTKVWLNAGSKLTLAKDFNADDRAVDLVGEAYFDVTHSADKPFTVHTKVFNLNVLGTAFNVKAYPADQEATATLIRGSISMRGLTKDSKMITLKPSEKAVFLNPDKLIAAQREAQPHLNKLPKVSIQRFTQKTDSTIIETAWINNRLEMYDQTFGEMKEVLERWFNVEIKFKSKAVENYRFRANYNNESITDVLNSLQQTQHFKYELKDRTVTISK